MRGWAQPFPRTAGFYPLVSSHFTLMYPRKLPKALMWQVIIDVLSLQSMVVRRGEFSGTDIGGRY